MVIRPCLVHDEIFFLATCFLRFYLFIHERHTQRSRDVGRGANVGLDPRLWDYDLSQRQMLNH